MWSVWPNAAVAMIDADAMSVAPGLAGRSSGERTERRPMTIAGPATVGAAKDAEAVRIAASPIAGSPVIDA